MMRLVDWMTPSPPSPHPIPNAAVQILEDAVEDGDIIFIKGSLGSGSWRVRDAILANFETASSPDTSSQNGGNSHAA